MMRRPDVIVVGVVNILAICLVITKVLLHNCFVILCITISSSTPLSYSTPLLGPPKDLRSSSTLGTNYFIRPAVSSFIDPFIQLAFANYHFLQPAPANYHFIQLASALDVVPSVDFHYDDALHIGFTPFRRREFLIGFRNKKDGAQGSLAWGVWKTGDIIEFPLISIRNLYFNREATRFICLSNFHFFEEKERYRNSREEVTHVLNAGSADEIVVKQWVNQYYKSRK
jgi:hypothetical protein